MSKTSHRICFYSPYIPKHTGGGEKYLLDCARIAVQLGHEVYLAVSEKTAQFKTIQAKYETFLGVSLAGITFIETPIASSTASWIQKILWTKQFDVLYYLTDGSLFFSLAPKNIVHIQIPFTQPKTGLVERAKLLNWQIKNTNSKFTRGIIEKAWLTKVNFVHTPMVKPPPGYAELKLEQKQPIILSVGRFFRQLHSKRQDVLVNFFRELSEKSSGKKWQLVLIGSVEDESFAEEVKKLSRGLEVKIIHDVSYDELWEWYQRASIYWHATGFEVDEEQHPEKVEHFGISTVEAMSQGCVPIVINKGGQPEILGNELKDLLWETQADCLQITQEVIQNQKKRSQYAQQAYQRSKVFAEDAFTKTLQEMIG